MVTSKKLVLNLPWTYAKLYCSAVCEILWYKQTDRHTEILLLYYHYEKTLTNTSAITTRKLCLITLRELELHSLRGLIRQTGVIKHFPPARKILLFPLQQKTLMARVKTVHSFEHGSVFYPWVLILQPTIIVEQASQA